MGGCSSGSDPTDNGAVQCEEGGVPWRIGRLTRLRRLAVIILLTYVGVCVIIGLLQRHLIYFPTRDYDATPRDVGLEFEDLTLSTADGVSIAAWYVPHPEPKGSLIFCHGNAGNMSDRLHSIKLLHGMGVNVLVFDYRGFGRSEGRPSEQGTYSDAVAVWRYLVETRGELPGRVILFGRSLGGAVAIELALRVELGEITAPPDESPFRRDVIRQPEPGAAPTGRTPGALVVESTFTSLLDIGRLHYPLLPVRWLLTYRYESIAKVARIRCPKCFFHGKEDKLIPFENGLKLFEAASEPKRFIETPGGHNDAGFTYSPEYSDQLEVFINGAM